MMNDLAITGQKRIANNSFTDEGKADMFLFIEKYLTEHKVPNAVAMAREQGVGPVTMRKYIADYYEEKRQNIMSKDDLLVAIQEDLFWELQRLYLDSDPKRMKDNTELHNVKDTVEGEPEFKDKKELLKYKMEVVDRILYYKKLENRIDDMADVKAAAMVIDNMGERVMDSLLERIRQRRIDLEKRKAELESQEQNGTGTS
jgi:hypothetical protein